MQVETLLSNIQNFLWSGPLLVVLLGVGIYQTWQCRFIQLRYLGHAFKLIIFPCRELRKAARGKKQAGDISAFQSLMTALAGAIGTGNITGIATAVAVGGFGALFWMWVVAFFGMATAYSETVLALKYRKVNANGEMSGGPMYSLLHGLQAKKLAVVYASLAAVAALGIGCLVQSNSVVDALAVSFPDSRLQFGCILAFFTGISIIGGVKSIGKVAGVLVPIMALLYLGTGLIILWHHAAEVPNALRMIISSAFNGQAAIGGFAGSTILMAMQNGAQYGIFANEAGLGSLAIAGASARTAHAAEQGLRSIGGVFFATMIVCTITGLVLAVTNVLGVSSAEGVLLKGSPLAMAAFASVHPLFSLVVVYGLILFAFTTMLAWAYYGEKCVEFLFGVKLVLPYRYLFTICVVVGAVMRLDLAWALANLASALMALPNLLSIVLLSHHIKEDTSDYLGNINLRKARAAAIS